MTELEIIDRLLLNRGLKTAEERENFLHPNYDKLADPSLLADMDKAVNRLKTALKKQERILIYGDYDADGVTSTALLLDAFTRFGFKNLAYHLPDRFKEGYGMNQKVLSELDPKPDLIVTVDCASMNHAEISLARDLGIDVIVTDHHSLGPTLPDALAVINPNRTDSQYPNRSLAGVGVAFSLVRAMAQDLPDFKDGQEKWLLDLVAIGTTSDLMPLIGENRTLVKYGLLVLSKTRRKGLKYLLQKSNLLSTEMKSDVVAFGIGPRFNAAGRLEKAGLALDILLAESDNSAKEAVDRLEYLNQKRRAIQDKIFNEASDLAELSQDQVLVLANETWHEGVVGIVASKIMEKFQKPVFILQNKGEIVKGSARSFGDFSISGAIQSVADLIESGGGHKSAGGVTLKSENLEEFRLRINQFYAEQKLKNQSKFLLPSVDLELADFNPLSIGFYQKLSQFEPFGVANPEPIFAIKNLQITKIDRLGAERKHLKLSLVDCLGKKMSFMGFSWADKLELNLNDRVDLLFSLTLNTWQGRQSLEGRIINLEKSK